MGLTLLRVPKFLRVRSFFLAVIIYAVGILIKPADAVSDNLNKNLTQGATTQVTPTKAARRKASATKKISKTSSPSKGAPKISPVERGDARIRWDKKWGPLVPHKTFPKKCDLCHVPKRWDVMRPDFHFDHLKETGYALEGAHASVVCLRCHNDRMTRAVISRGCSGCHEDPHKSTLGLDCKRCHSEVNWKPKETALGQHARTRFPLTGIHVTLQCVQCHARADAGDFKGSPVDCFSCHQADYNRAPNHVAMNFAHTCKDCHTTTTFTGALFDHSTLGPNPNCYSCHQTQYRSAQNPNHAALGIPTTCAQCHTTFTWLGATFDHATTGFTLTGKHATAQCADCHINNNYSIPNANCVPCHQADYNGAISPVNHPAAPASFPVAACQNCHGDFQSWLNGKFDHSTTGFPLVGLHMAPPRACVDCHIGNNYNITNTACISCHQNDYNRATSPLNHILSNLTNCQACHSPTSVWGAPTYVHSSAGSAGSRPWDHGGARTCAVCHNATSGYPTAGAGWFTCAGNGAVAGCHQHNTPPNVRP